MTSPPSTLSIFIDAAADAVARAIAGLQREAAREQELRAAEHRAKMAEWDARLVSVSEVERRLAERIASLKDGAPGRDGIDGLPGKDGADGKNGKDGDAGPAGKDADPAEIVRLLVPEVERRFVENPVFRGEKGDPGAPGERGADGAAGDKGPPGADGRSITVDDVAPLIAAEVARAVAAVPPPKDGEQGPPGPRGERGEPGEKGEVGPIGPQGLTGERGDVGPAGETGAPGAQGPAGERGEKGDCGDVGPSGKDGKLPLVKAWTDGVHYEGDVVAHGGGTWQALRDTGREPPHGDWQCLAMAGRDGHDGRSFTVRGTWSDAVAYNALDVVALNGAAFVAREDDPGGCPGEGWQMIAAQGKQGKPGNPGPATRGEPGRPGPPVVSMSVSGEGLLTLINADGSEVTCDLYPLLAKLG